MIAHSIVVGGQGIPPLTRCRRTGIPNTSSQIGIIFTNVLRNKKQTNKKHVLFKNNNSRPCKKACYNKKCVFELKSERNWEKQMRQANRTYINFKYFSDELNISQHPSPILHFFIKYFIFECIPFVILKCNI